MNAVQLMGILNLTPDSFSGDGVYSTDSSYVDTVIKRAKQLFDDGADVVDIGAESTNPNVVALSPHEEWRRLAPVLPRLFREFASKTFSLDTYHAENVLRAAEFGTFIINDVTGMNNHKMREIVAKTGFSCIVSHLPLAAHGSVEAAHKLADRLIDDKGMVKSELLARVDDLRELGVDKAKILLDPGIGFGKTMPLNRELLEFAADVHDFPVLIGYSRKRFLGEHRMEIAPNITACKIAVESGAAMLRVHDVKVHREYLNKLA